MVETLLRLAMERGADLVGWAALDSGELKLYSMLNNEQAQKFHSALVIARNHNQTALKGLHGKPTKAYEKDYMRLNTELISLTRFLENYLQEKGISCLAVHPSKTLDWRSQRGLISHKAMAERAGIGVRGRNNLLVTYSYHSAVRLCSLLTELRVPKVSEPVWEHPCSNCDDCLKSCPVQAIGNTVDEYRIDRCLAHLERVKTKEISAQICGACMAACQRN